LGLQKSGSETTVLVLAKFVVAEVDVEAMAELLQTPTELISIPSLEL
jgi:hypothetical protein